MSGLKISQSLVKEISKSDHCPKQVYYSFVEGKELVDPSESMLLGRYFESELLGACRGGEKQEARTLKNGDKAKPFADCDELVEFAKDVFDKMGLDLSKGESQKLIESEFLSGNLDHVNTCIQDQNRMAIYDVKWTATQEDDRWNGWAEPEAKEDAKIQAMHYTLAMYEITGKWYPFYFLVFGKSKWVRVIRFKVTEESIERYKGLLANVAATIKHYHETGFKGNGSFNKCIACPFHKECPDRATIIQVETFEI